MESKIPTYEELRDERLKLLASIGYEAMGSRRTALFGPRSYCELCKGTGIWDQRLYRQKYGITDDADVPEFDFCTCTQRE